MADKKLETIDLKGNAYAKVSTRLKKFREDFPKSKIEPISLTHEDGTVEFTTYIWKDKADLMDLMKSGITDKEVLRSSADSTGSAKKKLTNVEKEYEKLETIATGRALAMMGYLGSGEIASFEEMEEFNTFKSDQRAESIKQAIVSFDAAKTLDELKEAFVASKLMQEPSVVAAKDKRKAELSKPAKETPPPAETEDAPDADN